MLCRNSWYNNRCGLVLETPRHILINVHGKGVTMTATDSTTKTCTKCKTEHTATPEFFPYKKKGECKLHSWCINCLRTSARERYNQHLEEKREYARQYAAAHREQKREYSRKYYALHRDRYCENSRKYRNSHPEKRRKDFRAWRLANPDKVKARINRRRALKQGAKGSNVFFNEKAQLKRQKGCCAYCGEKMTKYHIEHVIPLSRGGSDHPDNKVLACPSCNLSKGNKLPHEWSKGGRLL